MSLKPMAKGTAFTTIGRATGHAATINYPPRSLQAKIWTEIVAAINNPEQTRQGYAEAQAKHDALTRRQRDHLANLQVNLAKAEARKVKLDRMYSDPELEMTKQEYLKQKGEIDAERKDLETRIETVRLSSPSYMRQSVWRHSTPSWRKSGGYWHSR